MVPLSAASTLLVDRLPCCWHVTGWPRYRYLTSVLASLFLTLQICTMLGWPVAADVLSGLRVGGTAGGASAASASPASVPHPHPAHPPLPLVHHMDHLLLGDKGWWRRLRPDVVLQLGPHLTSKRIGQFMVRPSGSALLPSQTECPCVQQVQSVLTFIGIWPPCLADDKLYPKGVCLLTCSSAQDWVALGEEGPGGAPPAPWVYVAPHTLRHDPSHLVSHRAVMGIAQFRDAVAAHVAAAAAGTDTCRGGVQAAPVSAYGRMLLELDSAVSHEVRTRETRGSRVGGITRRRCCCGWDFCCSGNEMRSTAM